MVLKAFGRPTRRGFVSFSGLIFAVLTYVSLHHLNWVDGFVNIIFLFNVVVIMLIMLLRG